jgi:hypothetical protein
MAGTSPAMTAATIETASQSAFSGPAVQHAVVHRWSGIVAVSAHPELGACEDPGSAALHFASLRAALRPGDAGRNAPGERDTALRVFAHRNFSFIVNFSTSARRLASTRAISGSCPR